MKSIRELEKILFRREKTDSHVHTHLCDGSGDMTVGGIAKSAGQRGIDTVILTPHFHKAVSDGTDTLYEDTDEGIILALREEIGRYERTDGKIRFLLSVEADIMSLEGETSLSLSRDAVNALDLVSPTLNYHPLLPLYFVRLTYGKHVNALHESGEYARAAEAAGGVEAVLEAAYQAQINAIKSCPYPMMLGHFFMSQSAHPDTLNCFGAGKEQLELMKNGVRETVKACKSKNAMIDLTGVHVRRAESAKGCIERNGFLSSLHLFTVGECERNGVAFNYGSDAHSLDAIAASHGYYREISDLSKK